VSDDRGNRVRSSAAVQCSAAGVAMLEVCMWQGEQATNNARELEIIPTLA